MIKARNKSTIDEYTRIKNTFEQNEEEKEKIIEQNDIITKNILEFLNKNMRGVKNGQQETEMRRK